ncbi:MAG: RAMP superfamily CRISPR-associated protein [Gemmataceae bacterium]|nr:RAMP superfamily CRISPR-associated protein [Gemmataceae bacterium]
MPIGENYWNPYRWVPAAEGPVPRERPLYRHRYQGLAGRLYCSLTALTPFLINDGQGRFIRSRRLNQPFIPATSLKGNIRSLAELIGNAAVPFPRVNIDSDHQLNCAAAGDGATRQFDVAARMFGYLNGGKAFAGLIRFSDGILQGREPTPLNCTIAVGQPQPNHKAFYPGNRHRKFYHHNYGATSLTPPHPGIKQVSKVSPLPPGVTFRFRVDFENLREEELSLLLYCLALEESVTVTLSPQAVGGTAPVTLTGPLRHKLGYGKPHGGGSVHIKVEQMELRVDPTERYRSLEATSNSFEGDAVRAEISRRTQAIRERTDPTMQHLRAMLIYSEDDPRAGKLCYPTFSWFNQNSSTQLKPTL